MKNNEKTGRSVEQHWQKELAQQGQKRGRDRFKQRKKREMKRKHMREGKDSTENAEWMPAPVAGSWISIRRTHG